jgi:cellulose synthase/poly-beta-1,6-N-acetylglucosamine synthase-like glycosyltransferase
MRCCQNKTSFAWSYRDSSKRSLENNVKSTRGKWKIHTLEISGHVQMEKSDPEAQRKSSLSDCTWLENEYGSFNLEALKFLMHFREPGSSLYFIFTHSYFSLFLIYIYIFFFLYFSFSFFLFLSHQFFFIFSSWALELHCTYLLSHA